jgi:hypothetical protein
MKTLFDNAEYEEIVQRINSLDPSSPGLWGKMSVSQMLAHCCVGIQASLGEKATKRRFLGYIFGPIAKKQIFSDKPFKHDLPTDKTFKMTEDKEFESEKAKLLALAKRFNEANPASFENIIHPFFGKMTKDELGALQWKHIDHHLQQFGK